VHLPRRPFPSLYIDVEFTMEAFQFCSMLVGLLSVRLELIPILTLRQEHSLLVLLYPMLFDPLESFTRPPMTRPRGRPKRGSPWKPRRPPTTPPDLTSDDSSPSHRSAFTPASLKAPQLSSMEIITHSPIALLRLLHNPPDGPSSPILSPHPPGNLLCGPSTQEDPPTAAPNPQDSYDREQFRNSLSVLHNLVFELRKEVPDLHFRLQATEAKVTSFLQIISSMHSALFLDPAADVKEEGQQRRPAPASTS